MLEHHHGFSVNICCCVRSGLGTLMYFHEFLSSFSDISIYIITCCIRLFLRSTVQARFLCAFYTFGSVRFWVGKQNFDSLVLFGSGRMVKHCSGRSLWQGRVNRSIIYCHRTKFVENADWCNSRFYLLMFSFRLAIIVLCVAIKGESHYFSNGQ